MSIDFYQTVMGGRYYDNHVPRIVDALERIANALEAIAIINTDKAKEGKVKDEHDKDHAKC